jgi:hypothetical protein
MANPKGEAAINGNFRLLYQIRNIKVSGCRMINST